LREPLQLALSTLHEVVSKKIDIEEIRQAKGIVPLVNILRRNEDKKLRKHALSLLFHLSKNVDNHADIINGGAQSILQRLRFDRDSYIASKAQSILKHCATYIQRLEA